MARGAGTHRTDQSADGPAEAHRQERVAPNRHPRLDYVNLLISVLQGIILAVGLYLTKVSLDEGNRIAWRTFLDTRASEMGRKLLDNEAMRCVYRYKIAEVDSDCPAKVYDRKNLSQVLTFVSIDISSLLEVKNYDELEDHGYYKTWYEDDASDYSDDPTGIVSFVLYDYYKYNTREQAEKLSRDLLICIRNENFQTDMSRCWENLEARRKKFLRAVGQLDAP
jgi:hypothetical protein